MRLYSVVISVKSLYVLIIVDMDCANKDYYIMKQKVYKLVFDW